MANIALTSIGVSVSYAVETVAGTRPTAGYTKISGLKSTPDFNQAPNTADATTFDNLEYTTKVALLKELPDTLEFNAVFGQEFANNWATLMTAYETGRNSGLNTWFCIDIPGYDKSIFFVGQPIKMGMPAMEVNSVIEAPVYIVPIGEPIFAADIDKTEYAVTFTVTGASVSAKVSGANVSILGLGYSKLTDADGVAVINLPNGTYNAKITKSGIAAQYKEVVVNGAAVAVSVTGFNS